MHTAITFSLDERYQMIHFTEYFCCTFICFINKSSNIYLEYFSVFNNSSLSLNLMILQPDADLENIVISKLSNDSNKYVLV